MKPALKIVVPAVLLACIIAGVPFIPPAAGDWMGWRNYVNAQLALEAVVIIILAGAVIFFSKRKIDVPSIWAGGALFVMLVGGALGLVLANQGTDVSLQNTYYVVAHYRYVMHLAAIFVAFAGFYYWFPKVTGIAYNRALGGLQFLLAIAGAALAFFPTHLLFAQPQRYADYPDAFSRANAIATVGTGIAAAALLVFIITLAYALVRRAPASD